MVIRQTLLLPQVRRHSLRLRLRRPTISIAFPFILITADPLIAAAAAKINAQLQARKGVQHVDVPPVEAPSTAKPVEHIFTPSPSTGGNNGPPVHGEMYTADGDYIQDIEVNDLRNRYVLTKPQTQQMIQKETGAGTHYCRLVIHRPG